MKKLILILLLIAGIARGQYCSGPTSTNSITPTTSTQTTVVFNSGKPCFVFNAIAGCVYNFSTCGLSTIDTYLSLYTNTISVGQTYNDDACGLQSNISWTCPASGIYSVLITLWTSGNNCNNINGNVRLSYSVLCPYPTTLTIPVSGSNTISCGINTTLYDNGGNGNYSNNNDGYTVINASTTSSININGVYVTESGFDYIYIYSGSGILGTLLATYNGSGSINYTGTLGQVLTIRFVTDASVIYSGFQLNITNLGSCSTLPIEILYFTGDKLSCGSNYIIWETASETNNDRFEVEHSSDGINFSKIGELDGADDSYENIKYNFTDTKPNQELNYYRLKQIDLDENHSYSNIISIDNSCDKNVKTIKILNLLGQEVGESYTGVIFIYKSDNTIVKKFQHEN